MRWLMLARCVVVLTLLALTRSAFAQDRHVSIELTVAREAQPDVVCVVAQRADPEPRASCDFTPSSSSEQKAGSKPKADEGPETLERKACVEAVTDAAADCILSNSRFCKTELTHPVGKSKVLCALDSQSSRKRAHPRLLVLELVKGPYSGVEPEARGLTMNGSEIVLRIRRFGAPGAEAAHLWVLGGHYESGSAAVTLNERDRVSFRLTPLHIARRVQFPPGIPAVPRKVGAAYQYTATIDGSPTGSVEDHSRKDGRISVPAGANGLTVSSEDFDGSANWQGIEPPDPIVLQFRSLKFDWAIDCLHDLELYQNGSDNRHGCPGASLPEVGADCENTSATKGVCSYECRAKADLAFSLPTSVEFTIDRRPEPQVHAAWQDQLRFAGQTLRSYVAADDRQLVVSFERWHAARQFEGEDVSHVLLTSHGNQSLRIVPKPGQRVRVQVPKLSCGEDLGYEVRGDLRYKTELVSVGPSALFPKTRPGSVVAPLPSESLDEPVTMALVPSGGITYPVFAEAALGVKWYAQLELAARVNSRALSGRVRSSFAGWDFRLGLMFSYLWGQQFIPGKTEAEVSNSYPYVRVPLVAHAVWSLGSSATLGAGVGLQYGRPLFNADLEAAPAQVGVIPASFILGFRVNARFAFELRARALLEHNRVTHLPTLGSQPVPSDDWIVTLVGGAGLRFDL